MEWMKPFLTEYLANRLSDEERIAIYRDIASSFGGLWDTVPEANVGHLAKRHHKTVANQADVKINNAGLRSSRMFKPQPDDVFRIVCLGDSFVFGDGGREQVRFSNLLERFYQEQCIQLDGKRIESYAVGLGSWT
jgi:hypothetical protein